MFKWLKRLIFDNDPKSAYQAPVLTEGSTHKAKKKRSNKKPLTAPPSILKRVKETRTLSSQVPEQKRQKNPLVKEKLPVADKLTLGDVFEDALEDHIPPYVELKKDD